MTENKYLYCPFQVDKILHLTIISTPKMKTNKLLQYHNIKQLGPRNYSYSVKSVIKLTFGAAKPTLQPDMPKFDPSPLLYF